MAFTTIIVEFSFWYRQVRLYGRPRNDLTDRFPLIVEALARLRSWSCIIDGEGSPATRAALRRSIVSATTVMTKACFCTAFDLLELNGDALHRDPLQVRKATLICGARASAGIWFNEHLESVGETVFRHACKARARRHFAKDQDVIQALAPKGPDQALNIGVLPGRPR